MAVRAQAHSLPLPPGRMGLPLIGDSLNLVRDIDYVNKRVKQYGPIFKTTLFGSPTIIMGGAEANRFILSRGMHHFQWEGSSPRSATTLNTNSLFVQDGAAHDKYRQLMAPAFHGEALRHYVAAITGLTRNYIQQWEQLGEFAWFPEMKNLAFDVASQLLMGKPTGSEVLMLRKYYKTFADGFVSLLGLNLPWNNFGRAMKARIVLQNHIQQAIRQRQHMPTNDLLGMLVQARDEQGEGLSIEDILDQVIFLLAAGHETTTSFMTSMCMAFAQNPEVWEKARAEQAQFDPRAPFRMEDFEKMPYLEQVLKEVERMYPSTIGGFRMVVEPFEWQGYHVPKDWKVLFSPRISHRDPAVFTDPLRFDPDRFSPERAEHKRQAFSLVGFGGGPRHCIGQGVAKLETKIVASLLLREYTWEILPNQRMEFVPMPVLRTKDGLRVRFRALR